ncbi:MAG: ABC transporter permease [Acidobacteriota bacterium]
MSRKPTRREPGRIELAVLALALRLYPRRFRDRFGDELRSEYLRRRTGQAAHTDRSAIAPLLDTVIGIPSVWVDEWRRREPGLPRQGENSMQNLVHEAASAWRVLFTRHLSFTALCVLTLTLGLGAVTSIFSVVHGVLLAPMPYGEPERIVRIFQQPPDQGFGVFSGPNFNDLRDRVQSFDVVAAYDGYRPEGVDATGTDRVERLRILRVGAGYFEALGVTPVLGRTFTRDEESPINAAEIATAAAAEPPVDLAPVMPRIAVLSHEMWRQRFGADPGIVGSRIELERESFEIVGVMPAGMGHHLGGSPDLWLPQNLTPGGRNHRGNLYMSVIGRLAPGASVDQARAELQRVTTQLREEHPRINADVQLVATPLDDVVLGPSRTILWVLFAAVGAMLAIACINVANLFLARGLSRRREYAVRAALGAGSTRLFASALVESLWIGLAAGALGLGVAWGAVRWLHALRPAALPRFDALALSAPVFLFSLAALVGTVLFFGLLPAARAARADAPSSFGNRGAVGAGGFRDRRLRDLGVSLQVALSLVLLTAGGLLGKSFLTLSGTDMGFEADHALTFQLRLPDYAYDEPEQRVAFYTELFDRLDAAPEIEASGATSKLPGNGHRNHWGIGIEGRERTEEQPWSAEIRCVAGRIDEALSIPLLAGRGFELEDREGAEKVVLVNRALATRFFDGDSALGARLFVGGDEPRTIVGIVGDARHDPREAPIPKIYVPQPQFADDRNWDLSFVVTRSADSPVAWAVIEDRVASIVAEIDPRLVVYDVEPLSSIVAEPIARQRFAAQLMMIFASLSLLLAIIGLFGALAYSLGQRRAELGVRMALGAGRSHVLGSVVSHGLRVFALGAAVGLFGAFAGARWLESQLHEVPPNDPASFVFALAVLFLAAGLATLGPALEASRLDPAKILHES